MSPHRDNKEIYALKGAPQDIQERRQPLPLTEAGDQTANSETMWGKWNNHDS